MQKKYDHSVIEKKWQAYWDENQTFYAKIDHSKPKYYVLDMFPYPSGSGLHVGHIEGYTATDIVARYKRMMGFNVLHPMGWDSFGLPAEQYAVRTGTHPAISTKANIDTFKRQLKAMGFSYDWSREIATSDPTYYKWTQWVFTKLYEKGLAYEAEMMVNYCPALGTVLANEEVENGKSKEGGHAVERRSLRQWMFKITEYADRLLDDLALVDWPSYIKVTQENWIGKSYGATVIFGVQDKKETITVFTTRADTLFGATFLVLAPEHSFVDAISTPEQKDTIDSYRKSIQNKSDLERTELSKEKTGCFTGAYAINPVNNKPIPVWIADYVLATYGTGAVMSVPGSDARDFDFAVKFSLPIIAVIDPGPEHAMRQEILAGNIAFVEEGTALFTFAGRISASRKRSDVVVFDEAIAPAIAEEKNATGDSLAGGRKLTEKVNKAEGTLVNSESDMLSINGLTIDQAKEKMAGFLEEKGFGKKSVHYKLRDWLFSRQRYWAEPIPVLHVADGTMRHLDIDELPLLPPEIQDYKPAGDGQSPLSKVAWWVNIVDPKTGKKAMRETNTMPQWAGSCWYYLRFADALNQNEAWSKEAEKYWLPVDLYVGGVEHAVLHLLYARFWHKVLYDLGLVHTPEPFQMLRNQGLIVARSYKNNENHYVDPSQVLEKNGGYYHKETNELLVSQVEKMSKSKLNGITPDDIITEYGADSLRLYEMFMGPLEKEKIWNSDAVGACRRFLARAFEMVCAKEKHAQEVSTAALKLTHKLIAKVSSDIENLMFNTSIAKMMEFVNECSRYEQYPVWALEVFVQLLSPFAPHIAEEMWQILGKKEVLSFMPFPKHDPAFLEDEVVCYVIQVNGKLRARLDLPKDETQEVIIDLAQAHPNVQKFLNEKPFKKVIFVPNKLLNIVS